MSFANLVTYLLMEITTRSSVAWGKFRKLLLILLSRQLPLMVRLRVYKACVPQQYFMAVKPLAWAPKNLSESAEIRPLFIGSAASGFRMRMLPM